MPKANNRPRIFVTTQLTSARLARRTTRLGTSSVRHAKCGCVK
jgi:hypothetical protein